MPTFRHRYILFYRAYGGTVGRLAIDRRRKFRTEPQLREAEQLIENRHGHINVVTTGLEYLGSYISWNGEPNHEN